MKTRKIWMWHGRLPQNLSDKLESFCDKDENGAYSYTGTLEDFEEKWGSRFIVMDNFIGITQYSSFGAR
jgi:hypothetical protein